jgi:hypothetical protein
LEERDENERVVSYISKCSEETEEDDTSISECFSTSMRLYPVTQVYVSFNVLLDLEKKVITN